MYKLIAVEGVSYVGKTSLSLKLAKSLKATYGIRVAQGYESREKKIHKNPDAEARFRFFYEELVERSKQLQETSRHTDVISDRYLISVFAYHNVILKKRLEEKCDIDKIYPADFTIFLVADKENLKLSAKCETHSNYRYLKEAKKTSAKRSIKFIK